MIKILMLAITALLSVIVVVLGFVHYIDSDDVFCRLYLAVAVNIIISIMVLGVVLNGLA